jgi:hypothetical protein
MYPMYSTNKKYPKEAVVDYRKRGDKLHRKASSIFLCLALVAGLLGFSAVSALADNDGDNVTSMMPDNDNAPNTDQDQLSDRPDGTDSLAHLTAVVTQDTTHVDWLLCPLSVSYPADQAEVTSCDVSIGSDTTPKQPSAGSLLTSADEAYDVKWDIPTAQDQQDRNILVLACVGAGTDVEDPGRNCRQTLEENIHLEDSGGGGAGSNQSSAGEMFAICTADTDALGGPDSGGNHGDEPCQYDFDEGDQGSGSVDPTPDVSPTEAGETDALFKPWEHGDPVPNNGFVIRASTSPDTLVLTAYRQYDPAVTSSTDMDTSNESFDCSMIRQTTSSNLFECPFTDQGTGVGSDDNVTQGVQIYGGLQGTCNPCLMDAHWTASSDRAAATLVASFEPESDGSPPPGTSCTSPDKEETNPLGDDHELRVCTTDQFGDPFDGDVTLESAGVGDFEDTGSPCTYHDHDGNQTQEHCHLTSSDFSSGQVDDIWIENNTTPGDQTITVCAEGEPGSTTSGSGNPAPSGHGCSDETVKDTLVKHWLSLPTHIHLVFQGTGTTADPCHTGDTTKENKVGDVDTLLVCTRGPNDTPATTNQTGGGRLQWTIEPAGGGEVTATRFVGSPPSETGADGTATAQIEAFRPGNDFINVELTRDNNAYVDDISVQKRVTGEDLAQCEDSVDNDGDGKVDFGQDPGCSSAADNDETDTAPSDTESETTVTIRYDNGRFKGQVQNAVKRCSRGRLVTLKRVRKGPDQTVGQDTANRAGNWSVKKLGANGRYYAKAKKVSFTKGNGATHTCLADRSVKIRVQS